MKILATKSEIDHVYNSISEAHIDNKINSTESKVPIAIHRLNLHGSFNAARIKQS